MIIGLAALVMFAGLVAINCKKDSKETKTTRKLDDSTFVELAARQNFLIQKYYLRMKQIKSDSEKVILSDEFNKETEKILDAHGFSREQLNNYIDEMSSDTQKMQEIQGKVVTRIRELIAESKEAKSQ
jgi:hypothetical protein